MHQTFNLENIVETNIINWSSIHKNGDLWWQHLKLRKRLFVDHEAWEVPHNEVAEWDQYDTANSIYVVTHDQGRVLAASRLNPCSFEGGGWSYMIKDAIEGKLPGIPQDILLQTPDRAGTWEATRFTVDPTLSSQDRNTYLAANAQALKLEAKSRGAKELIALMPPAYVRWLTSNGLPTKRLGPTKRDGTGSRICVIGMDLNN